MDVEVAVLMQRRFALLAVETPVDTAAAPFEERGIGSLLVLKGFRVTIPLVLEQILLGCPLKLLVGELKVPLLKTRLASALFETICI